MIAPRQLPSSFRSWNKRFGAPFGRYELDKRRWARVIPEALRRRLDGPFSVQPNNTTRVYEYPWAYYATPLEAGMHVLEIGGGLGGFQFVLDRMGCNVVNVDPGMDSESKGWLCDQASMAKLNRIFGTAIKLEGATVVEAAMMPDTFDRVFSISVIEHLTDEEIELTIPEVFRLLKPGGYFIATIDLFLDLRPFTDREANRYGRNIDVRKLIESTPFELHAGDPEELFGFPDFEPRRVQSELATHFVGAYPALAQCILLRKPD